MEANEVFLERYTCPDCSQDFESLNLLISHTESQHDRGSAPKNPCSCFTQGIRKLFTSCHYPATGNNVNSIELSQSHNVQEEQKRRERLKEISEVLFDLETNVDSEFNWEILESLGEDWENSYDKYSLEPGADEFVEAINEGDRRLLVLAEESEQGGLVELSKRSSFLPKSILYYKNKILSKLKKKNNLTVPVHDTKEISVSTENIPEEEQTIGVSRSYRVEFKSLNYQQLEKNGREIDRLMKRLDGLCTKKLHKKWNKRQKFKEECRKAANQQTCTSCQRDFKELKRHSCKVCAGVICKTCSKFLDFDIAKSIRKPTSNELYEDFQIHIQTVSIQYSNVRGANTDIRLCHNCFGTVEMQIRKYASGNSENNSSLIGLYDELAKLRTEAIVAVDTYEEMWTLCEKGEPINGGDMNSLCKHIRWLAENIDILSKRISVLPAESESRLAKISQYIRIACVMYIQDKLLSLKKVPLG